ncbi:MAG: hypothetical protein E8D45_09560 [Nitrospira sp.]|nr:MAG: hypothetical protein E8D45_09560 [Nitrospira sp.]
MGDNKFFEPECPLPTFEKKTILLAHGGGGRLMQELIRGVFLRSFDNALLRRLHDGATFPVEKGTLAFTTDSYVVSPWFFPGGDIGSLAVHGTINDLAMCGAMPLYLSAGFILEEGLSMETLRNVVESMAKAAEEAGVQIVTRDTTHLVASTATTSYAIERAAAGWIASFTSGEGFVCRFRGPGVVYIQSRNPGGFGAWIRQFIPVSE